MIKPGYKIYVGYEFEVEKKTNNLIEVSRPITGFETNRIHSYHGSRHYTELGLWRLEYDASLRNGAEFISPPIPMEESFEMMREFFQATTKAGAGTSIRCGCHTNICLVYGGKILKMNENAMLYNLDWRLLCSLWPDRLKTNNKFCKYLNILFKNISASTAPLSATKLDHFGRAVFNNYHGFITRKPSHWNKVGTYYELRFPGGEDYHLHPEKIETTVKHFSEVLNNSRLAACKTLDKAHDRKITSYINRKTKCDIDLPYFNNTIENNTKSISKLKNVKHLIKANNKGVAHNLLLSMMLDIIYAQKTTQDKSFSFYQKKYVDKCEKFMIELAKAMNKESTLYHICKLCFVYTRETGNQTSSMLDNLQPLLGIKDVEFTIPKGEEDLQKLWLVRYLYALPEQTKNVLVKSMKSNRVKSLLNKLIQDNRYLEPKFCKFINRISMEYSNNGTRNVKR